MIGRSLKTRLVVALVTAQSLAVMLAMMIFPLVAPFVSFDDIADATFRDRIVHAMTVGPGGLTMLQSDDALRAYRRRRPGAEFAVVLLADGRLVRGSDPGLGARLTAIRGFAPRPDGNLVTSLADGRTLIITTADSPHGRLLFATTGNVFMFEDWPSWMSAFLPAILPAYGPVIIGAFVLIPLSVAMITRPLTRLAADAALVSPVSMERRLGESGLGLELQALARAVNAALARIQAGLLKQRLYAANAAHELRTPIAILALHIDQLQPGALRARLQSDVSRVRTLVEQLVTVARLGQNHVPMDEIIDLVGLLRDVIADRAPIAIRERREIEFATKPAAYHVRGNRQALSSALANLLDNAIRAEPYGGLVSVGLDDVGTVTIADHGSGIREEDRQRVFEPFWRGSTTSNGAGLGLAIVKEIADLHRVVVAIVDTAGGGATFRLEFGNPAR